LELQNKEENHKKLKMQIQFFKNLVFVAKKICYFVAFQTLLVVHALITIANGKFFNVYFFVHTCTQPNPNVL
jgi:hypothetical protein